MSKQEILKAIRVCAKKLGRSPSLRELRKLGGITEAAITRHFGRLSKALEAAGLEAVGAGYEVATSALLKDWAAVARKLGKIPTAHEYTKAGKYSYGPFWSRYGSWERVREAFRKFAREEKIEGQWADVLKMIARREEELKKSRERGGRRLSPLKKDRPVYGPPLLMAEMAHEPVNEAGVIFAFGVLARRLGFVVLRWQTEYPDCEAMREMAKGQWQRVRIEFEFESRNFLHHRHDKEGCDVIVCWAHNWPECPVEVVELRKAVGEIGNLGNH
jgi:Homing endonuclease associated repeat